MGGRQAGPVVQTLAAVRKMGCSRGKSEAGATGRGDYPGSSEKGPGAWSRGLAVLEEEMHVCRRARGCERAREREARETGRRVRAGSSRPVTREELNTGELGNPIPPDAIYYFYLI